MHAEGGEREGQLIFCMREVEAFAILRGVYSLDFLAESQRDIYITEPREVGE